ncbi:uncharacterized protein LOC124956073 [Vespa velutina]|uniref:uncharacterized protein LOC124956073 n=1 Tax=Vespa velutina TaxID=202808 RepID=UPI001FB2D256|nr:uncharacterized protein LOC124956073 [Vespa velutina]
MRKRLRRRGLLARTLRTGNRSSLHYKRYKSSSVLTANERVLGEPRNYIEKRIPRKESVIGLRPAYKCIHKHLQQTEVFQRKTKKLLRKELLEVEIMNSKITCLEKLLRPEEQCEWRRSRSPRIYYRAIGVTSK